MSKPGTPHLRTVHAQRNGRPARRTVAARTILHLTNGRASLRRFRGWGLFRGLRRAVGEILGMAVVLALSIVLAHFMLIAMFPV